MEADERIKDLEKQLEVEQEKSKDLEKQLEVEQERIKTLERDVEVMENFMNMMNHDLRTPLINIMSISNLLLEETFSVEETKKFLSLANEASNRMMTMMESHIALEKMARGQAKIDLEKKIILDLSQKIDKIFSGLRSNKCSLDILLENPENNFSDSEIVNKMVLINEGLFLSMMTNLLKNAIEASCLNEKIIVNLFEDDNHFCISVSNSGEVPKKIQRNLFRKFSTSKKGGTGLGLYGAKLITEAHGGTLTYEPFPGGTRFTVRIPLSGSI